MSVGVAAGSGKTDAVLEIAGAVTARPVAAGRTERSGVSGNLAAAHQISLVETAKARAIRRRLRAEDVGGGRNAGCTCRAVGAHLTALSSLALLEASAGVAAGAAVALVVEFFPAGTVAAFSGAALRRVGAMRTRGPTLRARGVGAAEESGTAIVEDTKLSGSEAAAPIGLEMAAAGVGTGRLVAGIEARDARSVRADAAVGAAEAIRAGVAVLAAAHVVDGERAAAKVAVDGRRSFGEAVPARALVADVAVGTALALDARPTERAAALLVFRLPTAALRRRVGGGTVGKTGDAEILVTELVTAAALALRARKARLSATRSLFARHRTAAVGLVGAWGAAISQTGNADGLREYADTRPATVAIQTRVEHVAAAESGIGVEGAAAALIRSRRPLTFRFANAMMVMNHTGRTLPRGGAGIRRRGFPHGRPRRRGEVQNRQSHDQRCCRRYELHAAATLLLEGAA